MTVYIDPPTWPGHGRLWSHLISDRSYAELHDFAARLGIPPRAFERDHYDVIADRYGAAVAAGWNRTLSWAWIFSALTARTTNTEVTASAASTPIHAISSNRWNTALGSSRRWLRTDARGGSGGSAESAGSVGSSGSAGVPSATRGAGIRTGSAGRARPRARTRAGADAGSSG